MICTPAPKRSTQMLLLQCAWCRSIKVADGEWVRPSVQLPTIRRIVLEDMAGNVTEHDMSHSICEACRDQVIRELQGRAAE